ncbi:MAG: methyltransferase domain-containing protein [Lentisphaerae bacterium]|nr:methyltransferase domain-containing protein [Lentisphaerota bacterium]
MMDIRSGRGGAWPDLSVRVWAPELMDAPDCDTVQLLRTLAQFTWINRVVSRYRTLLTRTVLRDMQRDPGREYHLVDLGAGGCDIPVWLLTRSRRLGLRLRVTALDLDPRTVAWAVQCHGRQPGLTVVQAGAAELARFGPVDYVFANHFLHHLPDVKTIRDVMAKVQAASVRGYVISDIRRSRHAYVGVTVLNGLFFRRSFALADGQLSVRKSFTFGEMRAFLPPGDPVARVVALVPSRLAIVGGAAFESVSFSA